MAISSVVSIDAAGIVTPCARLSQYKTFEHEDEHEKSSRNSSIYEGSGTKIDGLNRRKEREQR